MSVSHLQANLINRRNTIYYSVRRWAEKRASNQVGQVAVQTLQKPKMVTVLKDGVLKNVDISTLQKDSFTPSVKYVPPLIVTYTNRP